MEVGEEPPNVLVKRGVCVFQVAGRLFQAHIFIGGTNAGAGPYGSLTLVGSKLFVMTHAGRTAGAGFLFNMNTDGTGFAGSAIAPSIVAGIHSQTDETIQARRPREGPQAKERRQGGARGSASSTSFKLEKIQLSGERVASRRAPSLVAPASAIRAAPRSEQNNSAEHG
jgi:hypothetical protein